ncbi:MAG: hypothetical protein V4556_11165 [Bacteroidota bacterium]
MIFSKNFLSPKSRLIIRATCIFWLIAKAISYKLWFSDREFPLVPPFDFLQASVNFHYIVYGISLVCLILLLISPEKKSFQIAVVIVEICACLFDQNRWQPWEYQYILTIIIFLINRKNEKNIIPVFLFMLAATYFYSGLGKLNPVFIQSIWHNLFLTKLFGISYDTAHQPYIHYAGYLFGLIEMILAIGLLYRKTQKKAIRLIILMHLIILALFGPLGLNYDHIIWPWNLLMISYFVILLWNIQRGETLYKSNPLKTGWNQLILVLFGIMPFFSLFGMWDYFLSSSLFSSRPTDMYICVPASVNTTLNKYFDNAQAPCDSNSYLINTRSWAFDELMVPTYPQKRVYKKIKEDIQKKYPELHATYYIYTYENGRKKVKEELK